jgi:hypothetical protein
MTTIYVPRSTGGTLILTITTTQVALPTFPVTAIFRSGSTNATYREGTVQASYRDGTAQALYRDGTQDAMYRDGDTSTGGR